MTTPATADSLFRVPPAFVSVVRDAYFRYKSHPHGIDSHGTVRLACNVLVLSGRDGLVLFDPGPGCPARWRSELDSECSRMEFSETGGLLRFLEPHGGAAAVSDIFLTHLHADHSFALFAGDSRTGRVFPRATLWSSAPVRLAALCSVHKAAYEIRPLQAPGGALRVFCDDAHAECHSVFVVPLADRTVVVWGDYLPTTTHLRPRFRNLIFDGGVLPPFYEGLLNEAAESGFENLLFHDPRRPIVRFRHEGDGYSWF